MDSENTGHSSCNSNDTTPMMIMPPPPPPPSTAKNDRCDGASGIHNPSSVRNLKDILKFTTQMTDTSNDNVETIDLTFADEKKKFLTNVLSTMSVNVHEEMNNSINILLDSKKQVEDHEYAFDVIEEYVDNIDYANDFQKLGGFQIFRPCLNSEHKTVRCKTAELISTLVQNNPFCQDKFMENPIYIRMLISLVEQDLQDEVRVKAFHAISSVVRQNVIMFRKFIDMGGNDLIVFALKSPIDKLKIKATFLINACCHMGKEVVDMFIDDGVVEIICMVIINMEKSLESCHHELFLSTLNEMLRVSHIQVKEICSSVENFKTSLLSLHNSYPKDDSNYQDEKDQILSLMETLTL